MNAFITQSRQRTICALKKRPNTGNTAVPKRITDQSRLLDRIAGALDKHKALAEGCDHE